MARKRNRSSNRKRKPTGYRARLKTLPNGVPTEVGGVTLVRQGNRVGVVKGKS